MSGAEVARRYAHLISMIMWACRLSHAEAVCCLAMYLDGSMFAGGLIDLKGGPTACVRVALQCRNELASMGSTETYSAILHRAGYYRRAA